MKKLLTLTLLLFCLYSVSAQTVNGKVACKAAETFWNRSFSGPSNIRLAYFECNQSDTCLFVYNIDNEGFVIVSGDYSTPPILAYSNEGNFKNNNQAPATMNWLKSYSEQIYAGRNNNNKSIKNKEWGELLSDYTPELQNKSTKTVTPLVTTKWDQGQYYNYKCPVYPTGPDGHCVTGCVATAMAQIMKYYNYPDQGFGSHWYTHPHFGNIGADFSATTYNWSNMGTYGNYTNQDAIGTLIFHCGVSVDMDYTPMESGAFSENAVNALKNYFHYRSSIVSKARHDYSDFDWIAILKDNLDQNHPILYSGSGSGGGHAWVCDGYDILDKFHMNWGWSGSNNGYFLMNNLTAGGSTFNSSQSAIVNIMPYFAPYCMASRTFTDSTIVISDGSGYSYYWNNTDCDWLIKPTGAEKVLLEFADFNTEAGIDIVSVYDGETTSSTLLGTFSGNNTPPSLIANSGKMLITFSSNNSTQDLGWTAKYWCLKHATGIQENNNESVSVYPNPAINSLYFANQGLANENVSVKVYDCTGKIVYTTLTTTNNDNTLKIDVGKMDAGFYIVTLQTENNNYRTKFIKQ